MKPAEKGTDGVFVQLIQRHGSVVQEQLELLEVFLIREARMLREPTLLRQMSDKIGDLELHDVLVRKWMRPGGRGDASGPAPP